MTQRPTHSSSPMSEPFAFTDVNEKKAQALISHYPEGRQASAILGLLDLAQRQCDGWLPHPAIEYVAQRLGMPFMRAYEVATFHTLFNLNPIGAHHVQVCTTTPCWLRGSDDILNACKRHLGLEVGQTTEDRSFTLSEVECLGACINAPVVQVNDDYYEDLTSDSITTILDALKKKSVPTPSKGKE